MTPRELLKAWLDLSTNRALSVETYRAGVDRLLTAHPDDTWAVEEADLFQRIWAIETREPFGKHPQDFDPAAYWTARKQLEAETAAYLETSDE